MFGRFDHSGPESAVPQRAAPRVATVEAGHESPSDELDHPSERIRVGRRGQHPNLVGSDAIAVNGDAVTLGRFGQTVQIHLAVGRVGKYRLAPVHPLDRQVNVARGRQTGETCHEVETPKWDARLKRTAAGRSERSCSRSAKRSVMPAM